jgi:antitoxin (DNA-binding transcriptional repressor) of toxin-antitoxin stability system
MSAIVSLEEAQASLAELLDRAAAGEDIFIDQGDRRVRLEVIHNGERKERRPGVWKGKVWIAPDFDDPLSEEVLIGSDLDDDGGRARGPEQ